MPLIPTTPQFALVMVGLPARGKSYIARRLARYLRWLGHETKVFNVGEYRRDLLGSKKSHDFFDPKNTSAVVARLDIAKRAVDDLMRFYSEENGQIGIYDATNTTRERRRWIREACEARDIRVAFIETICDDAETIERNVRETKLHSPDYVGVDPTEAIEDFRRRIHHYESVYEPVGDDEGNYVKVIDQGKKIVMAGIEGNILSRAVFFLMNLKQKRHPLYMCRHGESLFNIEDRVGGDSSLSPRGRTFAKSLAAFIGARRDPNADLLLWTSRLKRTIETAQFMREAPRMFRSLDEIDAGVCDGMTYTDIKLKFPDEFKMRDKNKLQYRYPQGESYADLIQRLDRVIIEIERHDAPILIIAHQGVLRALYGYLMDVPPRDCPRLPIPLHTVIELTPNAYGCTERRHPLLA
jgi:broad specificity phosphatase PhoE/predicted kinase